MRNCDSFIWTLKNTTKLNWTESLTWLMYILLGSLLPVYISIIILCILKQPFGFTDFTGHAEFGIYSATILASSAYVVLKDFRNRPFPRRAIFGGIIVLGLITASAIYATVTIADKIAILRDFFPLDQKLIMCFSLILFGSSIVVAYLVNILDSVITNLDLESFKAKVESTLDKEFDELER